MISSEFISGSYFEVELSGRGVEITGRFTAVSGLNTEIDYETYNEGGANFPRFFFKESKPQVLVLERGVVTSLDSVSLLMAMCAGGMAIPLSGAVTLKDSFGAAQRKWSIWGAYLQKYIGPELNSNQPALAVSRIELIYNGCY